MFQQNNALFFTGTSFQQRGWNDLKCLDYVINRHETLHDFYTTLCKLFSVVIMKGLRMVVENPYTQPHYLTSYFPIPPTIVDKDRTENGDYYKKPTQYWFVGFKPYSNWVFEPIEYVPIRNISRQKKTDGIDCQTLRSMIHPQYASRFIRQYILPEEMWR